MSEEVDDEESCIPSIFDSICFAFGENDAIIGPKGFQPICYMELQQSSLALARQLHHRYRPMFCLLDLRGFAAAEAVSMLACMRIGVPFVPVSVEDLHAGKRLRSIVNSLRAGGPSDTRIVAIARCDDDRDPIVSRFASVDVHNVVYVNRVGDLLEPMNVSESLPDQNQNSDNLYVLFTSGTSGSSPKAVVGSSRSTLHRLKWFANKFPSQPDTIIARRSKLTFVDSITEMFSALLFPPARLYAFDPEHLEKEGVSVVLSTPCTRVTMLPSQLSHILLSPPPKEHSMRTVIVSGEPCPASTVERFRHHLSSATLINLYGQTESTGDVLCAVLTNMENPVIDNVVAVGTPIDGVSVTLSPNDELIVTGNLANGYLQSDSPFTMFHTGDVGFCRDGCWYVKGRMDGVAKINGIITLPSEVEAVFSQIYTVPGYACIVRGQVYVVVEKNIPFSREFMRENGVPWNLIPKQVIQHEIPRTGGANKVDRSQVKKIIKNFLTDGEQPATTQPDDECMAIISNVLGLAVDETKSFVEMGGDSALAVTLLYKLRVANQCGHEVTAQHILEAGSISEFMGILNGEPIVKRKKFDQGIRPDAGFVAKGTTRLAKGHLAIAFKACVDAAPVVHGTDIYGACQGGIIQRIVKGKVSTHYDLGYKVQADLILVDNALIVCGYNPLENTGIVVAMALDLSVMWQSRLEGTIKSTPVQVGATIYVVAGKRLHVFNVKDGQALSTADLPSPTESKPAVVMREASRAVVYAFSDWDSGLVIVEDMGSKVTIVSEISCPVYADLLTVENGRVVVCDVSGFMHIVNINTLEVESWQMSSKPMFSGPIMLTNGNIVFGCHDGVVRCTATATGSCPKTCWEYDTMSVVYAKALMTHQGSVIACTTAGDVVLLEGGKETWRTKVNGEVWSAPAFCGKDQIVVGARDSCIHIIELPPRIHLSETQTPTPGKFTRHTCNS